MSVLTNPIEQPGTDFLYITVSIRQQKVSRQSLPQTGSTAVN